jgi:hypothetical protein
MDANTLAGLRRIAAEPVGRERAGGERPRDIERCRSLQARAQLVKHELAERRVAVGADRCECGLSPGCTGGIRTIRTDPSGQRRGVCVACGHYLDGRPVEKRGGLTPGQIAEAKAMVAERDRRRRVAAVMGRRY